MKEILVIGTGGIEHVDSYQTQAVDKFQESHFVIRSLTKGEKVTIEV
jgi:hypothetical protein